MPTIGIDFLGFKRSKYKAKRKRYQMSKEELLESLKAKVRGGAIDETKEV